MYIFLAPLFFIAFPCGQENNVKSDTYTGVYYLEGNIHIRNGATLEIDGTGDLACETLLLVRLREREKRLPPEGNFSMDVLSSVVAISTRHRYQQDTRARSALVPSAPKYHTRSTLQSPENVAPNQNVSVWVPSLCSYAFLEECKTTVFVICCFVEALKCNILSSVGAGVRRRCIRTYNTGRGKHFILPRMFFFKKTM